MTPKDGNNSSCTSGSSEALASGICPSTLDVTRGPLPASKKIYVGDLKVPMREISLTNGEKFTVYDCSSPYTDETADLDIMRGLPKTRRDWIIERGDVEEVQGRAVKPEVRDRPLRS